MGKRCRGKVNQKTLVSTNLIPFLEGGRRYLRCEIISDGVRDYLSAGLISDVVLAMYLGT